MNTIKTFKGFPVCSKHGITYRYREGCKECNKTKQPKKLDQVFKEMEEQGLLPKGITNAKDDGDNT